MASSASDRVLGSVPELLEKILFELPPRDLLLAQRVNKNFRDNIQGSLRIQQKLFFKRDPNRSKDTPAVNPFLAHLTNLDNRWSSCLRVGWSEEDGSAELEPVISAEPRYLLSPDDRLNIYCYMKLGERIQSSRESWETMLVTDPPRDVIVWSYSECDCEMSGDPESICYCDPVDRKMLATQQVVDLMNLLEVMFNRWRRFELGSPVWD